MGKYHNLDEQVREMFSNTVNMEINVDYDDFEYQLGGKLKKIRLKFNKDNHVDINSIQIYMNSKMEENSFQIYIGPKVVMSGYYPENDLSMFLQIFPVIFQLWCDDILYWQNQNEKLVMKLEEEEQYKLLYRYFTLKGNRQRAFRYLKKACRNTDDSRLQESLYYFYWSEDSQFKDREITKKLDYKNKKNSCYL